MLPNPFIELFRDPVATLAALAYALALLGASLTLAFAAWGQTVWLTNAIERRHRNNDFGPQWEYVPPVTVYGRAAALLFLAAIEALLLSALFWILT